MSAEGGEGGIKPLCVCAGRVYIHQICEGGEETGEEKRTCNPFSDDGFDDCCVTGSPRVWGGLGGCNGGGHARSSGRSNCSGDCWQFLLVEL
jgi:hypothetical protein